MSVIQVCCPDVETGILGSERATPEHDSGQLVSTVKTFLPYVDMRVDWVDFRFASVALVP